MLFHIFLLIFVNAYIFPNTNCLQEPKPFSPNPSRFIRRFWEGVYGEGYVVKLNSGNFTQHLQNHEETFVMFYANWCPSSHLVKDEFGDVAEEIAYTEGFNKISFGALDCNASSSNLNLCKHYNIATYPRFLFFTNGSLNRIYAPSCARTKDYFYHWIVNKGNRLYCSSAAASPQNLGQRSHVQNIILLGATILGFDWLYYLTWKLN